MLYFLGSSKSYKHTKNAHYSTVSIISLFATFAYFLYKQSFTLLAEEQALVDDNKTNKANNGKKTENIIPGLEVTGLPTFTAKEVSFHNDVNDPEKGVWISYKAGVYDVTAFVKIHPGGDNILLGAGNSVEPFWEVSINYFSINIILKFLLKLTDLWTTQNTGNLSTVRVIPNR